METTKVNKNNFWAMLPKPFFVLAPMEDVTDTVFRQMVASCAKPDVFFTEFTNCDGMQSVGRSRVDHRLKFTQDERPVVAQIWGTHPDTFYKTAQDVLAMGFDGVDINMGCPERSVVGHGACSALIKTPDLAKEIIKATKEGVEGNIPVSVKTRIGFSEIQTEEWISILLSCGISTLTVHGRTTKEMSSVPCHWDEIKKAVEIRDTMSPDTILVGNGDVQNYQDGLQKIAQSGVDGVMIGRGIFEDMWAFDHTVPKPIHRPLEYMHIMKRHVELYEKTWGTRKHYPILKKFFKIYVRGFEGASEWRTKCMITQNPSEVYPVIDQIIELLSTSQDI